MTPRDPAFTNKATTVPLNMDDNERKKMLSEALDSEGNVDTSESVQQTTSPVASKVKPPSKSMANNFKTDVTPSTKSNLPANQNKLPVVQQSEYAKRSEPANTSRHTIEGTNIGSRASEPDWSIEQQQHISDLCSLRLGLVAESETRRSIPDPGNKYLKIANDGSVVTKASAILPNIPWSDFMLGFGSIKADEKTSTSKRYSDVVMKGASWVLSKWTSENVVLEGVADNILDKPPRVTNGRPERRIGHDFARIGLPKTSFGPIFETLKMTYPSIMDGISITKGYYWLNASWGVTGSPGSFIYMDANKINKDTFKLYEAMKLISGYSSIGAGTIAISVTNECGIRGGKLVPTSAKYELSIKIHNMLHIKKVTYHSPPQVASTGFEVTDDMYSKMESLEPVSNMGTMMTDTASAFSNSTANPPFGVLGSVTNSALPGQNEGKLLIKCDRGRWICISCATTSPS